MVYDALCTRLIGRGHSYINIPTCIFVDVEVTDALHRTAGMPETVQYHPGAPTHFCPGLEGRSMDYCTLGTSDIAVSEISMGLWWISRDETWSPADEDAAIDTIHAAIDAGVNYFDTAERYDDGYSEKVLGKALADRDRDDVYVSTKVRSSNLRPSDLREACEASLDRLQMDYIDVYHIHWPNHGVSLADTMETMRELRQEGKIREIGISNFGPRDLQETCSVGQPITNQLPYSLLWRPIEHEIRDRCQEHEVGITCYSPLAQGLLVPLWEAPDEVPDTPAMTRLFSGDRPQSLHDESGAERETFQTLDRIQMLCDEADISMVQAALAWVLSRPGVDHVLVGGRTPEEIQENVRASEVSVSDKLLQRLTAATEELKKTIGPNPDMWYSESRYR